MKLYLLIFVVFLSTIDCISIKYRRWCSPWKFCSFKSWKSWSSCDRTCGGGVRTRYRQMCSLPVIDFTQHVAMCHKTLSDFIQYENCSQTCSQYGNWSNELNQCICQDESVTDRCCLTGRTNKRKYFRSKSFGFRSRSMVGLVIMVSL